MAFNLRNRSFLKEIDFSPAELRYLLQLAEALKVAKYAGTEGKRLAGKEIALIFEKTSTRTRSGFEVAAYDEGAHVTYLDPSGSQLGHKESIADTARVLGRMYDGIEFRGNKQSDIKELAEHAGVPHSRRPSGSVPGSREPWSYSEPGPDAGMRRPPQVMLGCDRKSLPSAAGG